MKDWDKELAKIDRLLEKQGIVAGGSQPAAAPAHTQSPAKRKQIAAAVPAEPAPPMRRAPFTMWLWAGLGGLLAASLTQWPYGRECGWALIGYLGAAGFVSGVGVWSAVAAWRQRAAAPHVLSVAVVFTGLLALGLAVLPHLGYAGQQLPWFCP